MAVYQVECDAEGVWRVDVGWSRDAQSYTVAIWDETGKDPSADDQGLIVGLGADGELPLLYDFLAQTTRYVDWTLPRNRAILAELKEARAHLLVRAAIAATMLGRYPEAVRLSLRGARTSPGIVARYEFWAVLASPAKRLVPPPFRRAVQRLFGAGSAA